MKSVSRNRPAGLAVWLLAAGLLLGAAQAGAAEGEPAPVAREYQNCIDLSARSPQAAFEVAQELLDGGGGVPARHCAALSLAGLGRFGEAARTLETAAEELRIAERNGTPTGFSRSGSGLISDLLAQAGNAWLLAGDAVQAYTVFSQGLTEAAPGSTGALDLLIDRARASGVTGDYAAALEDLDRAAEQDPSRAEIYILRASALRSTGGLEQAASDLERAFELAPDDREALLERGNLRLMTGDADGAAADWRLIVEKFPGSPAASAAEGNLQRLAKDLAAEEPTEAAGESD